MAARINKIRHDENTRAKIQASQLINRLTEHVLKGTKMETTQITAALGLLKKTLPDLSSIEQSGELDVHQHIISDRPVSANWTKSYLKKN